MKRRNLLAAATVGGLGVAAGLPVSSWAQSVNRIVIGFAPGGSLDYVARLLAERLRTTANPTWIVDSRPGAGGRIALTQVKSAPTDGSVLVLTPSATITQYVHVYTKLNYDPFADFLPVARIARFPLVLVAGPGLPAEIRTVKQLADWARAHPQKANFGSPAAGSPLHMTGLQIGKSMGVELTHVAYKGWAPMAQDLMGGLIPLGVTVLGDILPGVESGRLRPLAITGTQRTTHLPNAPTFQEFGYQGLDYLDWIGAFLPAKTSPATADALHRAIAEALKSPEMLQGLQSKAFEPAGESRAEFVQLIKSDYDRWGPIVRASGFTLDE